MNTPLIECVCSVVKYTNTYYIYKIKINLLNVCIFTHIHIGEKVQLSFGNFDINSFEWANNLFEFPC